MADFTESIRLNPKSVYPYNNRGRAYRKKNEPVKALRAFGEAIKVDPRFSFAYVDRGNSISSKRSILSHYSISPKPSSSILDRSRHTREVPRPIWR